MPICPKVLGRGLWGNDAGLLPLINSANIACGFHGGDYDIMAKTMRAAVAHGVSLGAHPGFYDLHGFGRRPLHLSCAEIEHLIAYQLGAGAWGGGFGGGANHPCETSWRAQ